MTLGERIKLVKAMKRPLFKRIIKFKSLRSTPGNSHHPEHLHFQTESRVDVDIYTLEMIQMVVNDLVLEKGSVTIDTMVTAISANRQVLEQHATALSTAEGKFQFRWPTHIQRYKRKYQLLGALRTLQTRPDGSSIRTRIYNWEQARHGLEQCLVLPPESTTTTTALTVSGEHVSSHDVRSNTNTKSEQDEILSQAMQRLCDIREQQTREIIDHRPSTYKWRNLMHASLAPKLQDQLQEEYQKRQERLRSQAEKDIDERIRLEEAAEEAQRRIDKILQPLSVEEAQIVRKTLDAHGADDDVIRNAGADLVQRHSFRTLRDGAWLNDEVIHFFLAMLTNRDEEMCQKDPNRRRSHFFKSFFVTKLLNVGSIVQDGEYQYQNVKRWSKKVPGKDIFDLDKIIFPINIGSMHWVCAVAFMQEKKIQFYDSMGGDGMYYLKQLFRYLKDEHMDKKKMPLPDEDQWQLVPCQQDTPQQSNGYDCGVFTCMFADFVSKDCPLIFTQQHVSLCRQRMALSILNGTALM